MLTKLYSGLKTIENNVNALTKSIGTKESPARHCRDIFLNNPKVSTGKYWIDPNLGSSNDSIEVHCIFEQDVVKTCVSATKHTRTVVLNCLF